MEIKVASEISGFSASIRFSVRLLLHFIHVLYLSKIINKNEDKERNFKRAEVSVVVHDKETIDLRES